MVVSKTLKDTDHHFANFSYRKPKAQKKVDLTSPAAGFEVAGPVPIVAASDGDGGGDSSGDGGGETRTLLFSNSYPPFLVTRTPPF